MSEASKGWKFLVGALSFLAAMAAFSRIVSMPHIDTYITDAGKALSNLFKGAFS